MSATISSAPPGLKKQIFGGVAVAIGLFNIWHDPASPCGWDPADLVWIGLGFLILLYGAVERYRGSGDSIERV